MALTVETGSIVSGADAYVSTADADAYFSNLNNTTWAALSTANKEAAIRAATSFIDATYIFRSEIYNAEQPLLWPRVSFYGPSGKYYPPNSVPQVLKDATCELAYEYSQNGAFLPIADRGNSIKRVKAGSVEVEYTDGASTQKTFAYVGRLMNDIVMSAAGAGNLGLIRV